MITIDEAIAHAREKAEEMYLQGMLCHANPNDDELDGCIECAREHEQLAEWLEELKAYREIGTVEGYKSAIKCYTEEYTIRKSNKQYNKAIDDLSNILKRTMIIYRKYFRKKHLMDILMNMQNS